MQAFHGLAKPMSKLTSWKLFMHQIQDVNEEVIYLNDFLVDLKNKSYEGSLFTYDHNDYVFVPATRDEKKKSGLHGNLYNLTMGAKQDTLEIPVGNVDPASLAITYYGNLDVFPLAVLYGQLFVQTYLYDPEQALVKGEQGISVNNPIYMNIRNLVKIYKETKTWNNIELRLMKQVYKLIGIVLEDIDFFKSDWVAKTKNLAGQDEIEETKETIEDFLKKKDKVSNPTEPFGPYADQKWPSDSKVYHGSKSPEITPAGLKTVQEAALDVFNKQTVKEDATKLVIAPVADTTKRFEPESEDDHTPRYRQKILDLKIK